MCLVLTTEPPIRLENHRLFLSPPVWSDIGQTLEWDSKAYVKLKFQKMFSFLFDMLGCCCVCIKCRPLGIK